MWSAHAGFLILIWAVVVSARVQPPPRMSTSAFKIMLPQVLAKAIPGEVKHSLTLYENAGNVGPTISGTINYFKPAADAPCQLDLAMLTGRNAPMMALLAADELRQCGEDMSNFVIQLQRLDVQVVLIADSVCQCTPGTKSPPLDYLTQCNELARRDGSRLANRTDHQQCDTTFPHILENEASFSRVRAPVVQIDWVIASKIRDCLSAAPRSGCVERSSIIGSFRWGMRTDPVALELFTSSENDWQFKQSFLGFAPKLNKYVYFQPRYFIFKATEWGCHPDAPTSDPFCSVACLNNAYCAWGSMVVNGKTVMEENLRQLCIFQQSGEISTSAQQWWEYVGQFASKCGLKNFTKVCSESVQSSIREISTVATEACVKDSWTSLTINTLFEDEIAKRQELNVVREPSIVLSGMVVRSELATPSVRSILTLVCERSLNPPPVCKCLSANPAFLLDCMGSTCNPDELYCTVTKKCYPLVMQDQFLIDCTICPDDFRYCPSLNRCSDRCPTCTNSTLPYYCIFKNECTESPLSCISPKEIPGSKDQEVTVGEIVALTMSLVLFFVSLGYCCWWKNQRNQFRSEVTEMMERYLPLDEQRRMGIIGRPTRVEPTTEQEDLMMTHA